MGEGNEQYNKETFCELSRVAEGVDGMGNEHGYRGNQLLQSLRLKTNSLHRIFSMQFSFLTVYHGTAFDSQWHF